MKYWSEKTHLLYDTEKELNEAEKAAKAEEEKLNEKKKVRAARAKEVEDALKAAVEAQNHYIELRNEFIDDYGAFHCSYTSKAPAQSSFDPIKALDLLFNI